MIVVKSSEYFDGSVQEKTKGMNYYVAVDTDYNSQSLFDRYYFRTLRQAVRFAFKQKAWWNLRSINDGVAISWGNVRFKYSSEAEEKFFNRVMKEAKGRKLHH